MALHTTEIHVANVCGPGVGRFLATTLADLLEGNSALVAVERSGRKPRHGVYGVDFVFVDENPGGLSNEREVIRVGLDVSGRVVCTEIVRLSPIWTAASSGPKTPISQLHRRAVTLLRPVAAGLRDALRSGDSVSALQWRFPTLSRPEGALTLTMRSHHRFELFFAVPSGD